MAMPSGRAVDESEGDVVRGVPITAGVGRVTFEDAAADLVNDYQTNRRRSLRVVELRLKRHLTPFFGHRRLLTITAADVRGFHGAAPGGRRVERLDQSGPDPAQTDVHARDASGEAPPSNRPVLIGGFRHAPLGHRM